jgi:hypothetical protein
MTSDEDENMATNEFRFDGDGRKRFYHATWDIYLESVLEFGLRPGPDGCVYMAGPLPAHAATFLAMRGGPVDWSLNEENEWWPTSLEAEKIYVFTIFEDDLKPELLHESFDHSAAFFPKDTKAVFYNGQIPPENISLQWEFNMADITS